MDGPPKKKTSRPMTGPSLALVCLPKTPDALRRFRSRSSFFLFHGDRNVRIGRQPYLIALDASHQSFIDVVVMALVRALPAIPLCQLDASTIHEVDSPDMDAISTDYFHMLFDFHRSLVD